MQVFNPYLPSYEYIPDAEPHIFDGRVYIYGSHDKFNGKSFCLNDYVSYSASIDNLKEWRYEGIIYKKSQDPRKNKGIINSMYAPDVVKGKDNRYYLYYFIGFRGIISCAVSNSPSGKFEYYGDLRYKDGTILGSKNEPLLFDPGLFRDDDDKIYIYLGFGIDKKTLLMGKKNPTKMGAFVFELEDDMLTVKGDLEYIGVPSKCNSMDSSFKDHPFFEASSMRKFNNKYYFIYSSSLGHELCYGISSNPKGPFEFGGTLVSNGDIGLFGYTNPKNAGDFTGNTHGSLIKIKDKYYVFYHRQTNKHDFSRQACAEEIKMDENGNFIQAERTSLSFNGDVLSGHGTYEARIASSLIKKGGNRFYGVFRFIHFNEPHFTQTGKDRESDGDQYIKDISDGTIVGFKYFDLNKTKEISMLVKGRAKGRFLISLEKDSEPITIIDINKSLGYKSFSNKIKVSSDRCALYFKYQGKGKLDFKEFTLIE